MGWGPTPRAGGFPVPKQRGLDSHVCVNAGGAPRSPPFFQQSTKKKKSHCCSLSLSNAGGSVNSRKGWRPQDAAPSSPGVLGEKPVVLGSNFVPVRRQRIVCQRFEFVGVFFFFFDANALERSTSKQCKGQRSTASYRDRNKMKRGEKKKNKKPTKATTKTNTRCFTKRTRSTQKGTTQKITMKSLNLNARYN